MSFVELLNAYVDFESNGQHPRKLVVGPKWLTWIKMNWRPEWGSYQPRINDSEIVFDCDEPEFRYTD